MLLMMWFPNCGPQAIISISIIPELVRNVISKVPILYFGIRNSGGGICVAANHLQVIVMQSYDEEPLI